MGKLKEAWDVVGNMPMKPNEVVLESLLTAYRNHGDYLNCMDGEKPCGIGPW